MVRNILFTLLFVVAMVGCSGDETIPALNLRKTFIPDNSFEQALIELAIDDVLDDSVMTQRIEMVRVLDISNREVPIRDLTGIEDFINLRELDCSSNLISEIDVTNLIYLEELFCNNNELNYLDISNNTALIQFVCMYNHLRELDVSNNKKLKYLFLSNNDLKEIDLSQNSELLMLSLQRNRIAEIDLSENTKLFQFSIGGRLDPIKKVDLSNNPLLTTIYIAYSNIQELNLKSGGNGYLVKLNLYRNDYLKCIQIDDEEAANSGLHNPYKLWGLDESIILTEDCGY
jgi:hypothetical protein